MQRPPLYPLRPSASALPPRRCPPRHGFSLARLPRGSGLAVVLMTLSVLVILTVAAGVSTNQHLRTTDQDRYQRQARYAAYAGLQAVLHLTAVNPGWDNSDGPPHKASVDNGAEYAVTVINNTQSAVGTRTAPDGTVVPAGTAYAMSVGQAVSGQGKARCAMSSLLWFGGTRLSQAVFAEEGMTLTRTTVDGWSSTEPTTDANTPVKRVSYALMNMTAGSAEVFDWINMAVVHEPTLNTLSTGDLRTNAVDPSGIHLVSSRIRGNVYVSTGTDPSEVVRKEGGTTIEGSAQTMPPGKVQSYRPPAEPVVNPGMCYTNIVRLPPGSYTDLIAGQGTIYLSPGVYYFSNNVSISGCKVILENPVAPTTVYIGKELVAQGCLINPDNEGPDLCSPVVDGVRSVIPGVSPITGGLPEGLLVLFCGDGSPKASSQMRLTGTKAWMVAAGAGLDVKVSGGSHLFGAVRSRKLQAEDSKIHYDRRLSQQLLHGTVLLRTDVVREVPLGFKRSTEAQSMDPNQVFTNEVEGDSSNTGGGGSGGGGGGGGGTEQQML